MIDFPPEDIEMAILRQHADKPLEAGMETATLSKVLDSTTLEETRALVDSIILKDDILAYILRLIRATRQSSEIAFGASTRAADALAKCGTGQRRRSTDATTPFPTTSNVCSCRPSATGSFSARRRKSKAAARRRSWKTSSTRSRLPADPAVQTTARLWRIGSGHLGDHGCHRGAAREIGAVPWIVLVLLVVIDMAMSLRRPQNLTFEAPAEVFVGETAKLQLELAQRPRPCERNWTGRKASAATRSSRLPRWRTAARGRRLPAGRSGVASGAWTISGCPGTRVSNCWSSVPKLAVGAEIRVVPNIRMVQSGQITTTVLSTLYGVKENRAVGEGSEFQQLRDFVQGMDIKTIDWKRSARRRSLVAKELRAERNHHVIVALDNGYLMREEIGGLPKIDHAVTAALATAWAAAIGGDLVGYYSYDVKPRTFSAPAPGRTAFARLRSWTAELSYVSRETNHTLALTELNARTPKRSLLIIFTDFVDTTSAELLVENIGILAKRHLLIFVAIRDPDLEKLVETAPGDLDGAATLVAANQALNERRLVFEKLSRMGVTIVDAKPNAVTARLISAYLEIKARELI